MHLQTNLKHKKIAIVHAFFKCRGGAEKLVFAIRNYYHADLYAGALREDIFSPQKTEDSFSQELFNPQFKFEYLHKDGKIPILLHLKRMFHWLFSQKIQKLENYDLVIFSGNVFFAPRRLKKPKKVVYCHTPPRIFTDRQEAALAKLPVFFRPIYKLLSKIVLWQYKADLQACDLLISNSYNIQSRLRKYFNLDSIPIYPAVDTKKFAYLGTGDYYLSHSRLEEAKRIPLILEAFARMPDKKLVICSTGPLEPWVKQQIRERNLQNIIFEGLVSQERLYNLVGNCLAGIVIPMDEDAGIVQCELMAAGKPVIGVAEGGLLETVIDKQTGFLLPPNPTVEDLVKLISNLDPEKLRCMRFACEQQAAKFSSEVFFTKLDEELSKLFNR